MRGDGSAEFAAQVAVQVVDQPWHMRIALGEVAAPGSVLRQFGVAGGHVGADEQAGEIHLLVFLRELDNAIHLAQQLLACCRCGDAELEVLIDLHAQIAPRPHVAQPLQRRLAPRRKGVAPIIRAEQEHWPCAEPQVVVAEVQRGAFGHCLLVPDQESALKAVNLLFALPQMPNQVVEIGAERAGLPLQCDRLRLAGGNHYRSSQLGAWLSSGFRIQSRGFALADAHREPHIAISPSPVEHVRKQLDALALPVTAELAHQRSQVSVLAQRAHDVHKSPAHARL